MWSVGISTQLRVALVRGIFVSIYGPARVLMTNLPLPIFLIRFPLALPNIDLVIKFVRDTVVKERGEHT